MITTGTDTDMDSIFSAGTAAPERVPRRREHGQVNNALKSLTRVLKKMCEEDAAPRPAKRTRTSHDLNDELTHLIRKKTELKKLRREMDSDDSDGETVGLQLSSLRDKIRVLKEKIFPTSVDSTCTPPAAAAAVANNNVTRTPPLLTSPPLPPTTMSLVPPPLLTWPPLPPTTMPLSLTLQHPVHRRYILYPCG